MRASTNTPPPIPRLPPEEESPATLVMVPGSKAAKVGQGTLQTLVDNVDLDILVGVDPYPQGLRGMAPKDASLPIFLGRATDGPKYTPINSAQTGILALPSNSQEAELSKSVEQAEPTVEAQHNLTDCQAVCVITPDISLSVSPQERSTTLDGIEEYASRLPPALRGPSVTHLSTNLRVGFSTTYRQNEGNEDAIYIAGIGTSQANLGAARNSEDPTATIINQFSNGVTRVNSIDLDAFGVQSVHGVGPSRHKTLQKAGLSTLSDIADTSPKLLADLSGIASKTAAAIHARATARVNGTIQPIGTDTLPTDDPVFIDIETDGLSPSTAWLIGVLDGGSEEGRYLTFREQEPGDGSHLEAFLMWLTGPAQGRPVVAWNGYDFDFPVIKDQLQTHHPERVSDWERCFQFDALWWATQKDGGNAALPGRTNKLEDVATALGWEPSVTGVDGATVAAIYSAYQTHTAVDSQSHRTPDWDRLERYCEDDVRALATIYEHLQQATEDNQSVPPSMNTNQGSLSDFC